MNHVRDQLQEIPQLHFGNLEVVTALGRGAKGVVFLARNPAEDDAEWLALKVISRELIERKAKIVNNDGAEYRRVCFEREVLRLFRHPLLPRLRGVLDTQKVVGYAIDYCNGRDLNALRKKQTEKMFSDDVIRFYAAELVMALEYVHSLGIVYRDLKPENVMVQHNGHIMLVDFDLSTRLSQKSPKSSPSPASEVLAESKFVKEDKNSKKIRKKKRFFHFHRFCNSGVSPEESDQQATAKEEPRSVRESESESESSEKSNSFVGTEDYVAPEIVAGKGHDFAVDWWSLGVVLYEMLYGTTPFRGTNRKETFYRILTKSPDLCGEATALRDLIRKLLEKDPRKRMEVEEIKRHDFFKGIEWDMVLEIPRPPSLPETGEEERNGDKIIDVESFVEHLFCSEIEKKNQIKGGEVKGLIPNNTDSDIFHVF
ncbi:serine/threonine-protein kinase OXI1-like [Cucumis melo var. makuwa]|uniref:non-specific serine/threonine protein kinase n=1 Tax=Cucumis melo var. makuwa TaxID=1194695 RepID=A0A5D3CI49_CUCMM|nr:serine/threonine-protein kinase OXI1-like [Cucumis melo var. makuwa]TYK11583.1 serine/threonine-protein kinase OXI1-like [Cucumis melo var. makuwa]